MSVRHSNNLSSDQNFLEALRMCLRVILRRGRRRVSMGMRSSEERCLLVVVCDVHESFCPCVPYNQDECVLWWGENKMLQSYSKETVTAGVGARAVKVLASRQISFGVTLEVFFLANFICLVERKHKQRGGWERWLIREASAEVISIGELGVRYGIAECLYIFRGMCIVRRM